MKKKSLQGGKMKKILLLSGLSLLVVLGCASGWIYNYVLVKNQYTIPQNELIGLQVSFMKQYGNDVTIKEAIVPKIYEVAWADSQGNSNVSMCVGGIWVLIVSQNTPTPNK